MKIKKFLWYLIFKLNKDLKDNLLKILFISFIIFIFNILSIVFFNFTYKSYNFFQKEYKNFSFEIFIDNDVPEDSLYKLIQFLNKSQLVKKFEYINPNKAIAQINEFLGWDISEIIKINNVPSSYRVWLNINYKNLNSLNNFFEKIQNFSFININKELMNSIVYWFSKIKLLFYIFMIFGLGFTIAILISLYALTNDMFKQNENKNAFFKFYGFNISWNMYSFYLLNFIIFLTPLIISILFSIYIQNIKLNLIHLKETIVFILSFNTFLYLIINKLVCIKIKNYD